MSTDILNKDLTSLFGLDEMSPIDQDTFLEDIGSLVIESVITKLAVEMNDLEMEELHNLITSTVGSDDMLEKLEEKYPQVNDLFKKEILAFKKEAVSVLSVQN